MDAYKGGMYIENSVGYRTRSRLYNIYNIQFNGSTHIQQHRETYNWTSEQPSKDQLLCVRMYEWQDVCTTYLDIYWWKEGIIDDIIYAAHQITETCRSKSKSKSRWFRLGYGWSESEIFMLGWLLVWCLHVMQVLKVVGHDRRRSGLSSAPLDMEHDNSSIEY